MAALLLLLALLPASWAAELAVIVHPDNPVEALSMRELRDYLRLERQLWPSGARAELYLRASDGPETAILLALVYHTDAAGLRRFWVEKLYRGEIATMPSVVPTAAQAAARVKGTVGAFSVVLATEVPAGVDVLAIDGRRPGEPGYPLHGP